MDQIARLSLTVSSSSEQGIRDGVAELIGLASRITKIAGVVEAINSNRSYAEYAFFEDDEGRSLLVRCESGRRNTMIGLVSYVGIDVLVCGEIIAQLSSYIHHESGQAAFNIYICGVSIVI